jgi:hypothetical protein
MIKTSVSNEELEMRCESAAEALREGKVVSIKRGLFRAAGISEKQLVSLVLNQLELIDKYEAYDDAHASAYMQPYVTTQQRWIVWLTRSNSSQYTLHARNRA